MVFCGQRAKRPGGGKESLDNRRAAYQRFMVDAAGRVVKEILHNFGRIV
jgi:hypothetical protein